MEKIMSQQERIKRAEEIYNRRRFDSKDKYYKPILREKSQDNNVLIAKKKIIRKMIVQILICTVIYLLIYTLQHSDQIFSKEIISRTREVLSYDISLESLYNKSLEYINNVQERIDYSKKEIEIESNESFNEEQNVEDSGYITQNVENENIDVIEEENNKLLENDNSILDDNSQEAIGGAETEAVVIEKSQEELDIEFIKENASIIWPLNGVITSRFGKRTPTEIVSANHCGLDIAGDIGESVTAAMEGNVTLVSSEGDYGKHIKIENGEITTLYAHCSKLLVKEGEKVEQGQKIAEVGETGRATGPHLHFEIRLDNRFINPEEILE